MEQDWRGAMLYRVRALIQQADPLDEKAFKALIRAAVARNAG